MKKLPSVMSVSAIAPDSLRTRMLTVAPDMVTPFDRAQHMITRPSGVPAPLYGAERVIALAPDVSASFYGTDRMLALAPDTSASFYGAVRRRRRSSGCRGRHRRGGRSRRIGGRPMMPAGPRAGGQRNKRIQAGNAQTDFLHRKLLLQKMFHPKQFCAPRFYFIR